MPVCPRRPVRAHALWRHRIPPRSSGGVLCVLLEIYSGEEIAVDVGRGGAADCQTVVGRSGSGAFHQHGSAFGYHAGRLTERGHAVAGLNHGIHLHPFRLCGVGKSAKNVAYPFPSDVTSGLMPKYMSSTGNMSHLCRFCAAVPPASRGKLSSFSRLASPSHRYFVIPLEVPPMR